jgi:hypothetical protein
VDRVGDERRRVTEERKHALQEPPRAGDVLYRFYVQDIDAAGPSLKGRSCCHPVLVAKRSRV